MSERAPALRSLRPEIGRLWVRRAFREWPGRRERWLDLAEGRLRRRDETATLPAPEEVTAADGGLLYVPPVDREQAAERDGLVASLLRREVPLLVQIAPGEMLAVTDPALVMVVVDLLEPLLAHRLEALGLAPPGAVALWPLLPGLTDQESTWEEACARLAGAGVSCVQAVVPELLPRDRRQLAGEESEGAVFSQLFHGRRAAERHFAATVARHGLDPFFRRPERGYDRRSRNQALAEHLALAAELWLRLGRPDAAGQDLYRASRWVEDTPIDVRALALEGNLEIVEQLRAPAAAIVGECSRSGSSPTVEAWLAEYVGPAGSGT